MVAQRNFKQIDKDVNKLPVVIMTHWYIMVIGFLCTLLPFLQNIDYANDTYSLNNHNRTSLRSGKCWHEA